MSTPAMKRIMSEDQRIDKLEDIQIKEIFVKQQVWKHTRDYLEKVANLNPYEDKGREELERIKDTNIDNMMYVIGRYNRDLEQKVLNRLDDYEEEWYREDLINELFDILTKDKYNEEKLIELARNHLKEDCKGCIGMPLADIIRDLAKKMTE